MALTMRVTVFVFALAFLFMTGCDSNTKKVINDNLSTADNDLMIGDEDELLGDTDGVVTDTATDETTDGDGMGTEGDPIVQDDMVVTQDDTVIVLDDDMIVQEDDVIVQDDVIVTDDDIVLPDCGNGTVDFGETCDGNTIECTAIDPQLYSGGKALCDDTCLGWNTLTCYEIATDDDVVDDDIVPDVDVIPVVDTVGDTSRNATGQNRMRGNFYTCTASRTLTNIEMYLDYTGDATVYLEVYESTALDGDYTPVQSITVTQTFAGAAFYSSGAVSIPLNAGSFYYIGARWEAIDMGYSFDNNASSYPTAFGEWSASMRYDNPGGAPASFNYGDITSSTTIAYYQRLTTE